MELKTWILTNTIIDEADLHQLNTANIKIVMKPIEMVNLTYGNHTISIPGRQPEIIITTHSKHQETFIKLKFGSNVFLLYSQNE
jgi:hypothetical protein